MIEAIAVSKTYRFGAHKIHAVNNFTTRIERGEYVAIMGPSGSGKSTCMHMLGCLQSPTIGQIKIDGEDVSRLGPDQLAAIRNTTMGFVFQSFHLLPRASALENVELPLIYGGIAPARRRALAKRALEIVDLGDRLDHWPEQLSGGEMQRVAIARAVVNRPHFLLADEPTGALDSRTSDTILQLFDRLNALGITIVLVTHNDSVACRAQRIMVLGDGRLIVDEIRQ